MIFSQSIRTAFIVIIMPLLIGVGIGVTVDDAFRSQSDFHPYWASFQLFVAGGDPYDLGAMQQVINSATTYPHATKNIWAPPILHVVLAPLLALPLWLIEIIWPAINLVCMSLSGWIWWRMITRKSESGFFCLAASLMFAPSLWSIYLGQIGNILLLFVTLAFWAYLNKRMLLSGVLFSLLAYKPHVIWLVWPLLLVEIFKHKHIRILIGLIGGISVFVALAFLISPKCFDYWINSKPVPSFFLTATLATPLRQAIGSFTGGYPTWPGLVLPILAAIIVLYSYARFEGSRLNWIVSLLSLSVLFAPYGYFADYAPLLCMQVVILALSGEEPYTQFRIFAILMIFQLLVILSMHDGYFTADHQMIFFPLVLLYLWWLFIARKELHIKQGIFLVLLAPIIATSTPSVAAPLTPENDFRNVNRAVGVSNPANYYGEWSGHSYFPSPADWREITIYHVMTDRFRDGDPTNNDGAHGGYSPGQIHLRHGGDFRGLTEKLDYIKGMGFDAILISPIFQNLYGSPAGYGQIDFTILDDRLGDLSDLRRLVTEAHRRRMYIIVDIVVNHLSNLYYPEGYADETAPFRMHQAEYKMLPRFPEVSYADFKVDNNFISEGSYCDVYDDDGRKHVDDFGKGSFWDSDIHHNGSLVRFSDPWNNHLGMIYSRYDDLRSCSQRVQDKLIAMTKALISSADIDAIRIDTPMQVPLNFFKRWTPAVKEHARSLGKNNFFMFGETYVRPRRIATMIGRGKTPDMYGNDESFIDNVISMDAGISYPYYSEFVESLFWRMEPKSAKRFENFLKIERSILDQFDLLTKQYSRRMLNFVNNHDQRRLQSDKDGIQKARLANLMLFFWPGIPLVYYGDEQDFSTHGTALDGHAREDMMSSIAWRNLPSSETANKATGDNFDQFYENYRYFRQLIELRKLLWPILKEDNVSIMWSFPESIGTVFSFAREGGEGRAVQIIINLTGEKASLGGENRKARSLCSQCTLQDLLDPDVTLESDSEGNFAPFSLEPFQARVICRNCPEINLKPQVIAVTPKHDAVVEDAKVKLKVKFDRAMHPDSVQRAVKVNGEPIAGKGTVSQNSSCFDFEVQAIEGINSIEIGTQAAAVTAGKETIATPYATRFRFGDKRNIIVNSALERDDDLINDGKASTLTPNVKLHHKAVGAYYYRVKNEPDSEWSEWKPYVPVSDWSIAGTGFGWKGVTVQYWADGSGTYYVTDGIDLAPPEYLSDFYRYELPEKSDSPPQIPHK